MNKNVIYKSSHFYNPEIKGEYNGSGEPALAFETEIAKPANEMTVVITVNYSVKGVGYNFTFKSIAKCNYIINDPKSITTSEVYELYTSAVSKLENFLNGECLSLEGDYLDVPLPSKEEINTDIKKLYSALHSLEN